MPEGDLDADLDAMTREQLVAEMRRVRAAVREHRDSSGHALCWHHPELWSTLPEPLRAEVAVPPWPQFMRGCVAYRASLDRELPAAPPHTAEFDE